MSRISIPLKPNLHQNLLNALPNVYWAGGRWSIGDPRDNVWIVFDDVNELERAKVHSTFVADNNVGSTAFALKSAGKNISQFHSVIERPAPAELRWGKVNLDRPLTYSVDFRNNKLPFSQQQLKDEIHYAWSQIESVCSVRFSELGSRADVDVMFQHYDGPGSVLGLVYLPSRGTEISACNCGNVIIDNAENFNLMDFSHVFFHESCHAMGLPHYTDGISIMNPFFRFGKTSRPVLDEWVINELRKRYPY